MRIAISASSSFSSQKSGITYADGDGTALARLLDGEGVGETEVGAPVTTTNGDDAELGDDDGSADSSSDFLGGLDTETDVALGVTDDDDGLEAGTLTGTGLLLDGLDLQRGKITISACQFRGVSNTFPPNIIANPAIFAPPQPHPPGIKEFVAAHLHDLILELGEEEVDDLVLLDGERVEVDLLHALDLAGLHETAELGDGLPLLLLGLAAATATATSTAATAAVTTTIATGSEAAATGARSSTISHYVGLPVGYRRRRVCCWSSSWTG